MTDNNQRGDDSPRTKWNDIRRVGPALLLAFAAVLMINPSFVGDRSNSVGSISAECDSRLVGVVSCPDGDSPCVEVALAVVGGSVRPTDPCTDGGPPPVTPTAQPAQPALPLDVPQADAIIGPIWLGAIQPTVLAPGLVNLQFPAMLDIFIAGNAVEIVDAHGAQLYKGGLPEGGKILVFGDAPMTVNTRLKTGATYTEVIPG